MNSHLKSTLKEVNNFLETHNKPPEDLLENFIMELSVSNLLIPAVEGDDKITFEHLESEEGHQVLPLFSDEYEYSGDNALLANPMSFYAEIVSQYGFNGAVINPENERFFLSKNLMEELIEEIEPIGDESLDADELKRISEEIKNKKLLEFIQKDSNFNKYDELLLLLEDAVFLNVAASSKDLSEYTHDGVIVTLEVGGFDLSVKTVGTEKYGLLFTSLDKIRETCDMDAGIHYYYQVASLNKLLNYILMNDMGGIILNPGLEEYYMPRNVLLDIYVNHKEIINNPWFYYAMHYAFLLEG